MIMTGETTRQVLHVGCGHKSLQHLPPPFQDGSWAEIRLDIDPKCAPDIIGTVVNMNGVAAGAVDAVFSSHNIEHVFPHEVETVLGEFMRVLKPEGFAVITCPDLQCLGEAIAAGRLEAPLYTSPAGPIAPLDILYGHRASIARGQTYMAHHGGFTRDTLSKALERAGFAGVGVRPRREGSVNLWAVATKMRLPRERLVSMLNDYTRHPKSV